MKLQIHIQKNIQNLENRINNDESLLERYSWNIDLAIKQFDNLNKVKEKKKIIFSKQQI